jgi:hypothetical protein
MFRCITESTGITALGTLYVGFGTLAADFTLQGYEDVVVSNGHVMMYPVYSEIRQAALYLRNDGRGHLSRPEFPPDSYFGGAHRGRGVVCGDLDRDGRLDLAFSHVNEPAALLRQTTELDGNFLELHLVGVQSCRDAVGAIVLLETSAGTQFRTIAGGGSYLSQNPYVVHFGIPPGAAVERLRITWPNGQSQNITDIALDQRHTIVQPIAEPQR